MKYFDLTPHNQQPPEDENVSSQRRGSKLPWPCGQYFSPRVLHTTPRETFLHWGLTGQDPWLDTSTCKEMTEFSIRGSVKGRKAPLSTRDLQLPP